MKILVSVAVAPMYTLAPTMYLESPNTALGRVVPPPRRAI